MSGQEGGTGDGHAVLDRLKYVDSRKFWELLRRLGPLTGMSI